MDLILNSFPALLGGLFETMQLMVCALVAGFAIALPLAVDRKSVV